MRISATVYINGYSDGCFAHLFEFIQNNVGHPRVANDPKFPNDFVDGHYFTLEGKRTTYKFDAVATGGYNLDMKVTKMYNSAIMKNEIAIDLSVLVIGGLFGASSESDVSGPIDFLKEFCQKIEKLAKYHGFSVNIN